MISQVGNIEEFVHIARKPEGDDVGGVGEICATYAMSAIMPFNFHFHSKEMRHESCNLQDMTDCLMVPI